MKRHAPTVSILTLAFAAALAGAAPPTPEAINKIRAAAPEKAPASPAKARKILVFNKPAGFRHSSIETGTEAMKILGEKSGAFTVDATDDPAAFNDENLKGYDAVCLLNTTGSFLTDDAQKKALMAFVRGGRGVIGIHSASDAHYEWDDYGLMIGGWFAGHPWNAGDTVTVKLDDPGHPINASFGGKGFSITDEIYQFRVWPYSRKRVHVLLSLDMSTTQQKPNMNRGPDGDYAVAWIHPFGQGRVFYCSLGHREDVYENPAVLAHYLAGIQYALGDLKVDDTPSEAGDPEPKPHAALIERLKGYTGADASPVEELDAALRDAKGDGPATERLEMAMLFAFNDPASTPEARREVAKRLWLTPSANAVIALKDMLGDDNLNDAARLSLERIDHPYAPYFLAQALNTLGGEKRIGVIHSIGIRRDANAVGPLAGLIQSDDPGTRSAAIGALGKIGGEQAAKAIAAARTGVEGDAREQLTDSYLTVAERFLDEDRKPQAATIYTDLFKDDEPQHVRVAALRGLLESSDKGFDLLIGQLAGDDRQMKLIAVRMLQEVRDERATTAILKALDTSAPPVQAVLIDALAQRRDMSAAPAVAKLAESGDDGVRRAALTALGRLGGAEHVELLAATAAGARGDTRTVARQSLAFLPGRDINPKVLALLPSAEPGVAVELIRALGERQADETTPDLLNLAGTHADPAARREAFRALGDLATPEHLDAILARMAAEEHTSVIPYAEKAVIAVSTRMKNPGDAVASILAAAPRFQGGRRASLLRLLGAFGGGEALVVVRGDLASEQSDVRESAVRVLAAWPTPEAADDLLKLAETGEGTEKILALRGYVRLAGERGDPQSRVAMLARAMKLADRVDEKRLVLAALSATPSKEALELAKSAGGDASVRAEAEQAIKKIEASLAAAP